MSESRLYLMAADAVVLLHGLYALTVVLGLILILVGWLRHWHWVRNFWLRIVHLGMILVVVCESWCGVTCPLTTWEHQLRAAAGESSYQGDFIAHLVHQTLFAYGDLAPWVFTVVYTLFGGAVLATLYLVPPILRPRARSIDCVDHPKSPKSLD